MLVGPNLWVHNMLVFNYTNLFHCNIQNLFKSKKRKTLFSTHLRIPICYFDHARQCVLMSNIPCWISSVLGVIDHKCQFEDEIILYFLSALPHCSSCPKTRTWIFSNAKCCGLFSFQLLEERGGSLRREVVV